MNEDRPDTSPAPGGDGQHLWSERAPADGGTEQSGAESPSKVCPRCSVVERTLGAFCPHCGTPYQRVERAKHRRAFSKRTKVVLFATVLVLLGGGSATGVVLKHNHDQTVKEKREAAARKKKLEEQRRAQEAADAQQAAEEAQAAQEAEDALTRKLRRSLVADLRKSIKKDAESRVAQGLLEGPILGVQCDPVGGGNLSNLDAKTGKYSCIAYNTENPDGTIEGYGFSATVNYETFAYQWHLGNN
jgi:hypothetical protein